MPWRWISLIHAAFSTDWTHHSPEDPLPEAIATGEEPFLIVGAIAGGQEWNVGYWVARVSLFRIVTNPSINIIHHQTLYLLIRLQLKLVPVNHLVLQVEDLLI